MADLITLLGDLWTPSIHLQQIHERSITMPGLLSSAAVVKNPQLDAWAAGPGTLVILPRLGNITGLEEQVQFENVAPETNKISAYVNQAAFLNRVLPFLISAAAQDASGLDPLGAILDQFGESRLIRTQRQIKSMLDGVFKVSTVAAALLVNIASESIAGQTADNMLTGADFGNATARLGELIRGIEGGVIWAHPNVIAGLREQDSDNFVRLPSQGGITIEYYRGLPIIPCSDLVRTGTTNGKVFRTYIFAPRTIAYGFAPQTGGEIGGNPALGLATFNISVDVKLNNAEAIDRTRSLVHLDGMKWIGTSASSLGPSNAELANGANWELVASDPILLGVVAIDSNG